MKKVLILTAGFGDGHNTAARNVADALEVLSDEVKVEVLDVFQSSLGIVNDILRKTYLGLARYAPGVWNGIYSMLDNSKSLEQKLLSFGKLKIALADILESAQPDCVLSTYPVYGHVIQEIYRGSFRTAFPFHHGGDRFDFGQFVLVSRAQRLVLRAQRGHGGGAAAARRGRGEDQGVWVPRQPRFRGEEGGDLPACNALRPSKFCTS